MRNGYVRHLPPGAATRHPKRCIRFAAVHHASSSPAAAWRRHACRSDHARFFGDRIDLVLDELELGLHGRELPGELFVLGDELLEEGDYAFVGVFGFHVSENGGVRVNLATAARMRRRAQRIPGRGREVARRPDY